MTGRARYLLGSPAPPGQPLVEVRAPEWPAAARSGRAGSDYQEKRSKSSSRASAPVGVPTFAVACERSRLPSFLFIGYAGPSATIHARPPCRWPTPGDRVEQGASGLGRYAA